MSARNAESEKYSKIKFLHFSWQNALPSAVPAPSFAAELRPAHFSSFGKIKGTSEIECHSYKRNV